MFFNVLIDLWRACEKKSHRSTCARHRGREIAVHVEVAGAVDEDDAGERLVTLGEVGQLDICLQSITQVDDQIAPLYGLLIQSRSRGKGA
jgi:hypothetical protein